MTTASEPRFRLGRCFVTEPAKEYLDECSIKPETLINRHAHGNWGDIPTEDYQANENAVKDGGRILSGYSICGRMVWVLTDKERKTTSVCLPTEW